MAWPSCRENADAFLRLGFTVIRPARGGIRDPYRSQWLRRGDPSAIIGSPLQVVAPSVACLALMKPIPTRVHRQRRLYALLGGVILATLPCYCLGAILLTLKSGPSSTATPVPIATSTQSPTQLRTAAATSARRLTATPTRETPYLTPTNTFTSTPLPPPTSTPRPTATPLPTATASPSLAPPSDTAPAP